MLSPRWRRAVDGYYSTVQKNILVHFETQASQINHHVAMANAHPDVSVDDWFMLYQGTSPYQVSNAELDTANFTLVMETTYEFDIVYFNDLIDKIKPEIGAVENAPLMCKDLILPVAPLMCSHVARTITTCYRVWSLDHLRSRRSLQGSSATSTPSTVLATSRPRTIDPVTAATQMGQDTGMAGQAAEAAMLGIPTSASFRPRPRTTGR